jgi:gas vesicle protein
MNTQQHEQQHGHRDYGFAIGLLTGACVGAGVAFWFAPRLAALRERVADSARELGEQVTDRYAQISARIDKAASDVTRQGQDVRDGVADLVAQGAHEVERYAKGAKSR